MSSPRLSASAEPVARLPIPELCYKGGRSALAHWLGKLQEDITVVKLEVDDTVAQRAIEEEFESEGQRLQRLAQRFFQKHIGGETLFAALDAYRHRNRPGNLSYRSIRDSSPTRRLSLVAAPGEKVVQSECSTSPTIFAAQFFSFYDAEDWDVVQRLNWAFKRSSYGPFA